MQIGQALGAMAAYAAPTLTAQLDALREYSECCGPPRRGGSPRSGATTSTSCSTGSRRMPFQPLPRCRRSSITSAGRTWASPSAPTSRECWRRVTRDLAASCTSTADSGPTSWSTRAPHTVPDTGLRSLGRLSENAGAASRHGPQRSRTPRPTNADGVGSRVRVVYSGRPSVRRIPLRRTGHSAQWRFRSARTGRRSGAARQVGDGGCARDLHRGSERPGGRVPRSSREGRTIGFPNRRTAPRILDLIVQDLSWLRERAHS
jgi:hypothetical protein